jgi:hypothetical protein
MEVKQLSDKCIWIKGKKEGILIDPDEESYKKDKGASRIIVYNDHRKTELSTDTKKVVLNGVGEYEVGGVEITGISGGNGDVVYMIVVDGVKVGVIGGLQEPLNDKKIDKVESLDVLVYHLNEKIASKTILEWAKKWGVNYLVPINYASQEKLAKEMLDLTDREGLEPMDSLKIEKDSLPDGLEIVILGCQK